jgi:hypothetical protein
MLALVLIAAPVAAQDTIADWFRSLKTPTEIGGLPKGTSCCSEADCKQREVRSNAGIREAWIAEHNLWAVIPDQAKITDPEVLAKQPFFNAVVCYMPGRGIVCYVPGKAGG